MKDLHDTLAGLHVEADGTTLIAPCMAVTLYFWQQPNELRRDFADQAMEALDADLTHYNNGDMRKYAKRGKKSEDIFTNLFDRPRPDAIRQISFRATADGCSAAELDITFPAPVPLPDTPEARAAAIEANRVEFEEEGSIFTPHITSMVATFPLDHPLSEPAALLDWVRGLSAVQKGDYVSGHAGYALNTFYEVGSSRHRRIMDSAFAAAMARHPGLDFHHHGSVGCHLLKYWPGHVRFLPRIKRVNWLTLVPALMIEELCGGRAELETRLAKDNTVQVHPAGDGMLIQAGPRPEIGNVALGERLPPYRMVAKALAPGRLQAMRVYDRAFNNEAAMAWLTAHERDDA